MDKEEKNDKKICNRIIMAINSVRPLSAKERRRDYAYGIFLMVLMIFVPLLSIPWLMAVKKPVLALLVNTVSIGTALFIGLGNRRRIIRSFYLTRDAHRFVSIENGNETLEDFLKTDEVLISTIPQRDPYIDVLYNWLCRRNLIDPNEQVHWYAIDSDKLMPFLNEESDLSMQEKVLLMTFKGRLPDDIRRFYAEAKYLGVYLLNNIKVKTAADDKRKTDPLNTENDPVDFDSMYTVAEKLGIRGYKPTHLNTCVKLWKEQVPERGQADSLQGELLRQLEKLRGEAQGNGNINWDANFAWFCDFIVETLRESKLFEERQMDTITGAVGYIGECGEYARRYCDGEISNDEANPMLFAYVDDDLYDYIADAIAVFAENNPEPICYEKRDFIYR